MRLRDISLLKKEMSRRRCLNSVEQMTRPTVHCSLTYVTDKAEAISTDPLPVLWDSALEDRQC
jgi:hypothetical protein